MAVSSLGKKQKRKASELSSGDANNKDDPTVPVSVASPKKKKKNKELSEAPSTTTKVKKNKVTKGVLAKAGKIKKKKKNVQGDDAIKYSVKYKSSELKATKKRKRNKRKKSKEDNISGPQGGKALLAVEYLKQWKEDQGNWKFSKMIQVWLNTNILDNEKVPDDVFPVWLEYMNGSAVSQKKIIAEMARKYTQIAEKDKKGDATKSEKYERARMIIQHFSIDESDSS